MATLPLGDFRKLIPSAVLNRCLLCADGTGTCADLCCGGIYGFGPSYTGVLVRNERGSELCRTASAAGRVGLSRLSCEEAGNREVSYMTRHHIVWPVALNRLLKRLGKPVVGTPGSPAIKVTKRDTIDATVHYLMVLLMQSSPHDFLFTWCRG